MKPHRMNRLVTVAVFVVVCAAAVMAQSGDGTGGPGRRNVPVEHNFPKGTQPIRGKTVKVEVVDAVDLGTTLKVAVRITSIREERVRCSLLMYFEDKSMGLVGKSIDLQPAESDLAIFSLRIEGGNGSNQLTKLKAVASNIRIGD